MGQGCKQIQSHRIGQDCKQAMIDRQGGYQQKDYLIVGQEKDYDSVLLYYCSRLFSTKAFRRVGFVLMGSCRAGIVGGGCGVLIP